MPFRSLIVHLDGEARCDTRIHLAARFAAAHDSHLIGVAATGPLDFSPSLGAAASHGIDEGDAARLEALQRASDWAIHFEARCRAEGAGSIEMAVREGEPVAVLLHEAHCADLTVIGQPDPASAAYRQDKRFVDRVLLHSARPMLVVPASGRFDRFGDSVLMAWDDSPGCARAAADALPLLKLAKRVHVRVWRRQRDAAEQAIRERVLTVQRWLTRHGVAADAAVETTEMPVGDAILRMAARLDVDLIVMGTYGHSIWTQRIIGGATRTALAHSSVPLLMSH